MTTDLGKLLQLLLVYADVNNQKNLSRILRGTINVKQYLQNCIIKDSRQKERNIIRIRYFESKLKDPKIPDKQILHSHRNWLEFYINRNIEIDKRISYCQRTLRKIEKKK
jgi:hypothetical protein